MGKNVTALQLGICRRGRVVLRAVGDGDDRDSCLCCISSLKGTGFGACWGN